MDQDTLGRAVAPLGRRAGRMIARGIIGVTRLIKGRQVAQTGRYAEETRDDTEVFQDYGFASRPHPGAEAVVVALAGDASHQIIIAVEDARYRFGPLKTGEVALYDDQGQHVYLYRDGIRVRDRHGNEALLSAAGLALTSPTAARVTAPQVIVDSGDIRLGTDDLRPVARLGDPVQVDGKTGSIIGGSDIVRAG
ncbi:hypothetical protein GCM10011497_06490 [Elstera cyanobacteriorum]|uniref:Bacteriophage Mu Gp45 N-terminal domain-containing protein n=1 Tax=Elstera cyanobacteriorum TaxID=2022747 RepID=A0A255XTC1_9PROT|nr:phage baseplate assembly protein V [Elstera cyanobacteriorum]OYQ20239.1 hypothetical protein CHR90_05890 [Elstera cyanobacteriorum]GFZ80715.1 hypothetical protein GCM10011497_06490 [Elstera cyanobacteriorum]